MVPAKVQFDIPDSVTVKGRIFDSLDYVDMSEVFLTFQDKSQLIHVEGIVQNYEPMFRISYMYDSALTDVGIVKYAKDVSTMKRYVEQIVSLILNSTGNLQQLVQSIEDVDWLDLNLY
jgi:hypothetical protein